MKKPIGLKFEVVMFRDDEKDMTINDSYRFMDDLWFKHSKLFRDIGSTPYISVCRVDSDMKELPENDNDNN